MSDIFTYSSKQDSKVMKQTITVGCTAMTFWLTFIVANICAWVHHVVFCIQHHEYLLLIAGAIVFPIGIIHGWGLWFGWFTA